MDKETLARFKALFEREKATLTCSFGTASESFRLGDGGTADEADLTSTEIHASMRMRLRQREALYLRKVDQALQRIKEGSYGQCAACGVDIELKRLEARPTATHCLGCKEEAERRESLHVDPSAHLAHRRMKLA